MTDAHIADGVGILSNGGLHGAVGIHHVRALHGRALVEGAFFKGFAGAAAVFAHVERNGSVLAAEFLPVGDLAGKHVLDLRLGQRSHGIGRIHGHGHAVDGKGEGFQTVLGHFAFLEGATGVADLHEALAHLLHAYAGTAAGHRDADVAVGAHDGLRGLLHHRNVRRAAGDIKRALLALEGIQRSGHGQRRAEQHQRECGKNTIHAHLTQEAAPFGNSEASQRQAQNATTKTGKTHLVSAYECVRCS